jgi:hypothetical protein
MVIAVISNAIFARNKFISCLLLIGCFLIYQPCAVFGVLYVLFELVKNRTVSRNSRAYLLLVAISSILALLIGKIVIQILKTTSSGRTHLISSPGQLTHKLFWIISRPILLSFRPFFIESHGILMLAYFVISIFLVIVSLVFRKKLDFERGKSIKFGMYLVLIYLFSLIYLIPIAENQIDFRVLPTSSAIGLFLIVASISFITKDVIHLKAQIFLSFLIIISVASYSYFRINEIFISSFRVNSQFVLTTLGSVSQENIQVADDFTDWPQNNYVGSLSVKSDFQMPWVPIAEISQILKINSGNFSIVNKLGNGGKSLGVVVNLNTLKESLR